MNRFPDLRSGGRALAAKLDSYRERNDVVVLAILLGGSPVAHEVAKHLGVPLDFLTIRRLFVPQGPASQICAVNISGSLVIDKTLIPPESGPSTPEEYFVADAIAQMNTREQICRRERPAFNVTGKTVILVDCGIHTGLTMQAAIAALKTKEPAKLVAAVPVSSEEGGSLIDRLADEFVCLEYPEPFGHVGMWYRDLSRPDDNAVGDLLG